jgi:hypothetical protein
MSPTAAGDTLRTRAGHHTDTSRTVEHWPTGDSDRDV